MTPTAAASRGHQRVAERDELAVVQGERELAPDIRRSRERQVAPLHASEVPFAMAHDAGDARPGRLRAGDVQRRPLLLEPPRQRQSVDARGRRMAEDRVRMQHRAVGAASIRHRVETEVAPAHAAERTIEIGAAELTGAEAERLRVGDREGDPFRDARRQGGTVHAPHRVAVARHAARVLHSPSCRVVSFCGLLRPQLTETDHSTLRRGRGGLVGGGTPIDSRRGIDPSILRGQESRAQHGASPRTDAGPGSKESPS